MNLPTLFVILAPFSIIGSIVVIVWVGLLRKRSLQGFLSFVIAQAVCDLIFALKFFLNGYYADQGFFQNINQDVRAPTSNPLCIVLGMMGQFGGQGSVGFNAMISIRAFLIFWRPDKYANIDSFWFHLYVWTWSTATTGYIALFHEIGPTVDGCWITGADNQFRFWFFDLTTSIYFFGSIFIILYIFKRLRALSHTITGSTMRRNRIEFQRQMILYVASLIVFWSVPATMRLIELFTDRLKGMTIVYVDGILLSTQGAANALIWILTTSKCTCCQRQRDDYVSF